MTDDDRPPRSPLKTLLWLVLAVVGLGVVIAFALATEWVRWFRIEQ